LLENRRMPQTWQLLRLDRCEPPSISVIDREDVRRMYDWTEARVKAEKFKEIDFNTLVNDETMMRFLEYTISENKKTVTKSGVIKKKGDTLQSPRQAAKKRPAELAIVNPREISPKKKKAIPLVASVARRTPPKSPTPETNAEESSVSF
jgi:hypothetical protein